MQHKKRAIIIAVDHRAAEMNEIATNRLDRKDIDDLDTMINSEFETNVRLHTQEIHTWLGQFINSNDTE